MNHSTKTLLILAIFALCFCAFNACKHESETTATDKELYEMAKLTGGYTYYKKSTALLNKSAGSGHPQPFLQTRYNPAAATKLDSNGQIKAGTSFPEGSMIVKELYGNSTTLSRYAILFKNTGHEDADAKGWIWGYINADGSVAESSSKKGSACISCHTQTDHIDYMLMNKYFP